MLIMTMLALVNVHWNEFTRKLIPLVSKRRVGRSENDPSVEEGKPVEARDIEEAKVLADGFVYLHNRLYISILDNQMAAIALKCISNMKFKYVSLLRSNIADIIHRLPAMPSITLFSAPCLKDILQFDHMASGIQQRSPTKKIVFQVGSEASAQATMAFLLGCHMMLSNGLGFEETFLALGRMIQSLDNREQGCLAISMRSCLRAFCRAKCSGWIRTADSGTCGDSSSIHIDEYLHYAR